jgi:hypothetical protein
MTAKALRRVGLSGLSNAELREVAALAIEEIRRRHEYRTQEIIARIRALAAEGRLTVTIGGHGDKPGERKRAAKEKKPGNVHG